MSAHTGDRQAQVDEPGIALSRGLCEGSLPSEQALDLAGPGVRGEQLQAIAVEQNLLATGWLGQERIDGGLQAGSCPPAGREHVFDLKIRTGVLL